MTPSFAIIGAGPSGLYAADALTRKVPGARIDVIERLPTPFGLVRGGVAPDHQGTKAISRQFSRTLGKEGVRFLGNVAVGEAVSFEELKQLYDAVIIASGAEVDRRLGIPGEDLDGVYGSGAFVGWYNGHPDHCHLAPLLDRPGVVVIGNGNVAIDVVRVLAKTPEEMATSDICAYAAEAIAAAPIAELTMAGRRGPVEASFTPAELGELGRLDKCRVVVDASALPAAVGDVADSDRAYKEKNLETLHEFAAPTDDGSKPVSLTLLFHAAPVAIVGDSRVEAVRFERTRVEDGRTVGTGETFDVPCGTVVSAIGYVMSPIDGVPMDEGRGITANTDGRIAPGVYAVGWAKRGPSGTIPTNRADSIAVVDLIAADVSPAGKPGGEGLNALLAERGVRIVDLNGWNRIDAVETGRATGEHPREKFTTVDEMLAVL